jgi:hypothetical protein
VKLNRTPTLLSALAIATLAIACGSDDDATYVGGPSDGGAGDATWPTDSDVPDSGTHDVEAGTDAYVDMDGGMDEAGETSDGDAATDANTEAGADASTDANTEAGADASTDGSTEAGVDASTDADTEAGADASTDANTEAGVDASTDANTEAGVDASMDAATDTGVVVGDCISGAVGTRAVRFRWAGSGSGSTAYVVYEANQLPDTSRWRVRALSSNIGYTPVFTDVYLGEGGLDLGGTVFIDVELSTLGLSSVKSATIAVYGRSFHTTSSGSFTWQTFSGTGATPSGYVANSAPYEWYPADATAALPAGDGSTLLRLRAGPPSGRLVVNRVEICFDAE